jgi:uncharacterized protein (DUF1330 family)
VPKGYVVFTEDVRDAAGMGDYGRAAGPTIHAHGGRTIVYTPAAQSLEGSWHGTQTVIVEFDSVEAAQAWYDSPEYTAARALRQAAADTNAVILAGFERPPAAS